MICSPQPKNVPNFIHQDLDRGRESKLRMSGGERAPWLGGRTAVSSAAQGAEACERHSEASGGRGSEEEDEAVI